MGAEARRGPFARQTVHTRAPFKLIKTGESRMARQSRTLTRILCVTVLGACAALVGPYVLPALAQQPDAQPAAAGRGGRGPIPVDPRVQMRDYVFEGTSEKIPYAVFGSSK